MWNDSQMLINTKRFQAQCINVCHKSVQIS